MGDILIPEVVSNGVIQQQPQLLKNWAEDENVRDRITQELLPLVRDIRARRQPLSTMWNRLLKVWTLEHENPAYVGRSQLYIPAGKKGTETIITQLVSATFPGDDNFSVEARVNDDGTGTSQKAQNLRDILNQRIENCAKVRVHAERFYRQLGLTGNSPVKIHYRRKMYPIKDRSGSRVFKAYDAPVFESIDINNFYVWPEDVNDMSAAEVIFEDISLPYSHLQAMARKGIYVQQSVDQAKAESSTAGDSEPHRQMAETAKLQAQGITSTHTMKGDNAGWALVDIVEIYLDFDPEAADKGSETNPVPFLITMTASGKVLRAIENPFWHKRPPYLLGRMGLLTGRIYGTGWVEGIHQLNIMLNAQVNQMMDAANFCLNPIVLSNPNLLLGDMEPMAPGANYLVADINAAMRFDRMPPDLIQSGSVLTTGTMSWINDFIGAPPVLSGGSTPGRAFKTATGVGTAQRNAAMPLQEMVRLCEVEVWEQMLFMFWSLDQQFADDDFFLYTAGGNGNQVAQRVSPEDIAGDWMFKWLASSQTSNQQVKGQQITELLQILGQPGVAQLLQQNGIMFNPGPLIRRLYQEVYGFRDVNEVLKIVQAALPPPASGGAMPPQGGAPAGGSLNGTSEDLNGNGEFGGMRAGANGLAGLLGALNQGGGFDGGGGQTS